MPSARFAGRRAGRLACAVLLVAFAAGCGTAGPPAAEPEAPHLLPFMTTNAYLLHKLALAVEARNGPLADFYAYELDENLEEAIAEVPEYEEQPVGMLMRDIMLPFTELLQQDLEARAWDRVDVGVRAVVEACNRCHAETDHAFIVVTSGAGNNAFNQQFQPLPDAAP